MIKKTVKILIIFVLFFGAYFLVGNISKAEAALSCSVASSCSSGVVVMHLSGTTNAHAELPSQTNYSNLVCCTGVTGLANTCTDSFAVVARLSGVTNAHIEQNDQTNVNYNSNNACLSVPSGGSVMIAYQDNNCTGYDTTLASMSGITNAHSGDGSAYTKKICASASSLAVIPSSTSISINGGVSTTSTTSVTLTLAATNASEMMISNDSGFFGSSWETFTTSKAWTLTSGNGIKTVYIKYKSSTSGISASISDDITLSSPVVVPPSGGGGYYYNAPIITPISTPVINTVCPQGDIYSITTGKICTSWAVVPEVTTTTTMPMINTVCPWGDIYSTTTGKLCTSWVVVPEVTTTTTTTTEIKPVVGGVCQPYLLKYIKLGANNDRVEVKKLQTFLNKYENFSLIIDGIYGRNSFTAVVKFQERYAKDILMPWGFTKGTGYVFSSTLRKINQLKCSIDNKTL